MFPNRLNLTDYTTIFAHYSGATEEYNKECLTVLQVFLLKTKPKPVYPSDEVPPVTATLMFTWGK